MRYRVVMGEDGEITLPPDLLARLGWTTDTPLRWTMRDGQVCLEQVESEQACD